MRSGIKFLGQQQNFRVDQQYISMNNCFSTQYECIISVKHDHNIDFSYK